MSEIQCAPRGAHIEGNFPLWYMEKWYMSDRQYVSAPRGTQSMALILLHIEGNFPLWYMEKLVHVRDTAVPRRTQSMALSLLHVEGNFPLWYMAKWYMSDRQYGSAKRYPEHGSKSSPYRREFSSNPF